MGGGMSELLQILWRDNQTCYATKEPTTKRRRRQQTILDQQQGQTTFNNRQQFARRTISYTTGQQQINPRHNSPNTAGQTSNRKPIKKKKNVQNNSPNQP